MKKLLALSVLCVASVLYLPGCITAQQQAEVIGAVSNAVADVVNHNPSNGPTPVVVPTNTPAPVVVPVATNTPAPVAAAGWNYALFTDPTPYENSSGAASQMGYLVHPNGANENPNRIAMLKAVAALHGNVNSFIVGKNGVKEPVKNMCLMGAASTADGHFFPIKAPTATDGEVDWVSWMSDELGIKYQLAWVFNDDNSMPFTRQTIADAVAATKGSRIGMSRWGFGTCLETDEVRPNAADGAQLLAWIAELAPQSRAYIGSSKTDYLIAVWKQSNCPRSAFFWLEVDTASNLNPITQPVTLADVQARAVDKADRLVAAGIPRSQVVIGEIWSKPTDRLAVTQYITAKGYACSGTWK